MSNKSRFEKAKKAKRVSVVNPLIEWEEGLQVLCICKGIQQNVQLDESFGLTDVILLEQEDGITYMSPSAFLVSQFNDGKMVPNKMYEISCLGQKEGKNYTYFNFMIEEIIEEDEAEKERA